jgi:hypothetical protein
MLLGGERGRNRIGAAIALAVVLAMVLASPAGAAGGGEERDWAGAIYQHVLAWLSLAPSPAPSLGVVLKCDQGSQVDPNGCPKVTRRQRPHIDPNGAGTSLTNSKAVDAGSSIDPNGHS